MEINEKDPERWWIFLQNPVIVMGWDLIAAPTREKKSHSLKKNGERTVILGQSYRSLSDIWR